MRLASNSSFALILASRLLICGVAAGALVAAWVVSRTAGQSTAPGSYVCPMHPEVTSASPAYCPICRMALEPAAGRQLPIAEPASTPREKAVISESGALVLPPDQALTKFHAARRVKRFESMFEMRAQAWAETAETGLAILYLDEAQLLAPEEEALFFPSAPPTPGKPPGIPVRTAGKPPERWDRATTRVRFHVQAGAKLVPGQTGSIKFKGRLRDGLVVPANAVLDSPEGPYVLVVSDDRRTLTKRHIEIGTVLYDYAAVISGLRENEYVAGKAFFLDAERRFRGGAL
jgi:hypothetical protein